MNAKFTWYLIASPHTYQPEHHILFQRVLGKLFPMSSRNKLNGDDDNIYKIQKLFVYTPLELLLIKGINQGG